MKKYGLIGFPLAHSFSKKYFTQKFIIEGTSLDFEYENYELEHIADFNALLLHNPELAGLNVTIPYKEKIIPFLDELVGDAQEIQAVNTIKIHRNEKGDIIKKSGLNTDVIGFSKAIYPLLKPIHTGALILGTGGASLAVEHVFKLKNIPVIFISRTKKEHILDYGQISQQIINDFPIIVNTTPLGTYPNIDTFPPLPYHLMGQKNLLFDLVYNPAETKFMQMGKQAGAIVSNGYEMLVEQAETAWDIWNS